MGWETDNQCRIEGLSGNWVGDGGKWREARVGGGGGADWKRRGRGDAPYYIEV